MNIQPNIARIFKAEKCKPSKIYSGMRDVYGESDLSEKMFTNELTINSKTELKRQSRGVKTH